MAWAPEIEKEESALDWPLTGVSLGVKEPNGLVPIGCVF